MISYRFGFTELQREGKGVPEASLPFHRAMPSLTHMALVELENAGILKFVISQVSIHGSCQMGSFNFYVLPWSSKSTPALEKAR